MEKEHLFPTVHTSRGGVLMRRTFIRLLLCAGTSQTSLRTCSAEFLQRGSGTFSDMTKVAQLLMVAAPHLGSCHSARPLSPGPPFFVADSHCHVTTVPTQFPQEGSGSQDDSRSFVLSTRRGLAAPRSGSLAPAL